MPDTVIVTAPAPQQVTVTQAVQTVSVAPNATPSITVTPPAVPDVSIAPPVASAVTVALVGQQGPTGPAGPAGAAGERVNPFVYHQTFAASSWVVDHQLGRPPQVRVTDELGNLLWTAVDIDLFAPYKVYVTHTAALTGYVVCT